MEMLSTKISLKDFETICRICLSKDKILVPISSPINKHDETLISQALSLCFSLKIEENDDFPPNICLPCVENIKSIFMFRKKYLESFSLLKHVIENSQRDFERNEKQDFDERSDNCDNSSDSIENEEAVELVNLDLTSNRTKNKDLNKKNVKPKERNNKKRKRWVSNKCKVCYEQFTKREELLEHSKKTGHKQEKRIPCEVCWKPVSEFKIKIHMLSHNEERPFKCPTCSHGFSSQANMQRHTMIHTGERPHICEHCGKGFIQKYGLQIHRKVHECKSDNQSSFKCPACPRQFKVLYHYERHLTHQHPDTDVKLSLSSLESENLNHECDECGKRFKERSTLRTHKQTHGEKLFLCNTCGNRYSSRGALDSHLRTHTGEKPFKCEYCGKAFSQSSSYGTHLLIHRGLKAHQCHLCDKKFTQSPHLLRHLKRHSGEKPFNCSFCGKAFTEKTNMVVHERTHTGETPYLCPVCGKGFYDSSSRRKHCRSHGLDVGGSKESSRKERERHSQYDKQKDTNVEKENISEIGNEKS